MKTLVRLDLVDSEVTDEGIKQLAGLPYLQYLDLSGRTGQRRGGRCVEGEAAGFDGHQRRVAGE